MAIRRIRTRFYFAVEGKGEQSFVRLLQEFCNQEGLSIHLDTQILNGGGYRAMLDAAICHRKRRKNKEKSSILLIDEDRDQQQDDGWTLMQLRREAKKEKFQVCIQIPNQEGLFFRMFSGNQNKKPSSKTVTKQLKKIWPKYRKPVDFQMLLDKFTLDDLLRVSKEDSDIDMILKIIGLK